MNIILNYLKQFNENISKAQETLKKEENPRSQTLRTLERTIYFTQFGFVLGFTGLMLKFALFNHYRRYNKTLKFSIVWLYQISIDPLTIFAGYLAVLARHNSISTSTPEKKEEQILTKQENLN